MVNLDIPVTFRRVAAAFDEAATRARTPCDESSGSDHSPENMADLRDLVESFMERDEKSTATETRNSTAEESDSEDGDGVDDFEDVMERLRGILCGGGDHGGERRRIATEVEAFAHEIAGETEASSSKRHLMAFLRNKGFDSGLCKSRWEKFGRNPSGKYEYVDVQADHNRYIVETNLVGEFQIARPTERYLALLAEVPRVFVGTSRELKLLVRIMCNEIRLSMKQVGIHVPPWRRNGFVQAKWFGHYKRTVNEAIKVKGSGCDCDRDLKPHIGFVKTGCREVFRREDGLNIGRLMIAFGGHGCDLQ
ncbi:PREDICTED: uncharacterized protein LOC104818570 [Tarenaya hassleriana]|uniref:uncharacterized protein LOC104818570 n=1 Tax=Tarenaya hassleriana TaxID=28532 RepID=UPI00053C76F5|nr:PREDICTED: uncharacterized protein LOC104818570 [Tarenaya hassleriana]